MANRLLNDGYNELDDFNNNFNKPRYIEPVEDDLMEEPRTLTIYEYIAETKPADSHFLINKFGKYRRARDPKELAYQLRDFVRTFGDKGLKALAEIHPDRDLIEIECRGCKEHKKMKPEPIKEPRTKEIIYHNASGNNNEGGDRDNKMLIFGGLLLVAVAILMGKK